MIQHLLLLFKLNLLPRRFRLLFRSSDGFLAFPCLQIIRCSSGMMYFRNLSLNRIILTIYVELAQHDGLLQSCWRQVMVMAGANRALFGLRIVISPASHRVFHLLVILLTLPPLIAKQDEVSLHICQLSFVLHYLNNFAFFVVL